MIKECMYDTEEREASMRHFREENSRQSEQQGGSTHGVLKT